MTPCSGWLSTLPADADNPPPPFLSDVILTHLAVDGNVSSSTQNQALAALLFLYRKVLEQEFGWLDDVVRAKRSKHVPVVFTHDEACAVLA